MAWIQSNSRHICKQTQQFLKPLCALLGISVLWILVHADGDAELHHLVKVVAGMPVLIVSVIWCVNELMAWMNGK